MWYDVVWTECHQTAYSALLCLLTHLPPDTVQYSTVQCSTVQYSTHLPLDTRTPGGCSAPPRPPGARRPGAGEQGTEVPSLLLSCYLAWVRDCSDYSGADVATINMPPPDPTHHTSCFMSCMDKWTSMKSSAVFYQVFSCLPPFSAPCSFIRGL